MPKPSYTPPHFLPPVPDFHRDSASLRFIDGNKFSRASAHACAYARERHEVLKRVQDDAIDFVKSVIFFVRTSDIQSLMQTDWARMQTDKTNMNTFPSVCIREVNQSESLKEVVPMKTTKTVAYALACIAELAKRMGEFVQVSEIAGAQNIPPAYCQKILLSLSRSGIVMSVKGQGFTLLLPPESLTTLRVLQALSEDSAKEMGTEENESVQSISQTLAAKVNSALGALTVAELFVAIK